VQYAYLINNAEKSIIIIILNVM